MFAKSEAIKNEMKVVKSKLTNFDKHKADNKELLNERNAEIHEL